MLGKKRAPCVTHDSCTFMSFECDNHSLTSHSQNNYAPIAPTTTQPRHYTHNSKTPTTMLPLGLLTAAQGHPMLVELKNGETLNGHLVSCDTYMNLTLKEVVQTSPEGDRFFRLPECYVRGNNVRIPA